jgi:hypothetical protein
MSSKADPELLREGLPLRRWHIVPPRETEVGSFTMMQGRSPGEDRMLARYLAEGIAVECVQERCNLCAGKGAALRELIAEGTLIVRTEGNYSDYSVVGLYRALEEVAPEEWDEGIGRGAIVPLPYLLSWGGG